MCVLIKLNMQKCRKVIKLHRDNNTHRAQEIAHILQHIHTQAHILYIQTQTDTNIHADTHTHSLSPTKCCFACVSAGCLLQFMQGSPQHGHQTLFIHNLLQ